MLVKGWKARVNQPPDSDVKILGYAFAFFRAAQRAFINADNFLLAAALIGGRLLPFLGADFPFHFAQRCFIASEIRLRADALIRRRRGVIVGVALDFGGRPRRGPGRPSRPSSAEIAWSMRPRSDLSSANTFSRSTKVLSGGASLVSVAAALTRDGTAQLGEGGNI